MIGRRYEILCAVMLGFGHLSIMVGYDTESFVLESVIHSIHGREPDRIGRYAGYYGQAVMYVAYVIGCLFSPSILNEIGSKPILIIAAFCFTSFPLGFLFTNSYYYYLSAIVLGIGYSLYYQGNGGYMTSHSTRETISSNVNIAWSVGCCCLILGSGILAGMSHLSENDPVGISNVTEVLENGMTERLFSNFEITLLFGAFTAIGVLAIINFSLIPSKEVENCIQSNKKKGSFVDELALTCRTLVAPGVLQLFPLFFILGISSSFVLSIFPTAMNFNKNNTNMKFLLPCFSLGIGISEVLTGLFLTYMSKKVKDFCMVPTMFIGTLFTITYSILIHLSTPFEAPIVPTAEEPILFQQTYLNIFILAIIIGIGDCCFNTCRSVICAVAMPDRKAQVFSISKLYQAIGSGTLFFLSPVLKLYWYTVGIPILSVTAMYFFYIVARRTQNMERKLTVAEEKEIEAKL